MEKRFGYDIITIIGFSTYALYSTLLLEVVLKGGARILDLSIQKGSSDLASVFYCIGRIPRKRTSP
jgi:hypothetical protein